MLTNKRGDRKLSYLSRPNYLSAYIHYFLPWNLYRLCILLPALELTFSSGDVITDLGCGPLTFASALWIAYPQTRNLSLEINCIDRSNSALNAGKKFLTALCNNTGESSGIRDIPWKINIIKEDIDFRKKNTINKRKKASLVCAINLFNEVYEHLSHNNTEALRQAAEKSAMITRNEAAEKGLILTVEPGVPQSGKFISLLRGEFLNLGYSPIMPCTHLSACPCLQTHNKPDGGRKWCHFSFETIKASKELHILSQAAKLPKDRLAFSFLLTGRNPESNTYISNTGIRIISDAFPLPDKSFGRYGCSSRGLILLTGEKNRIEKLASLNLVTNFTLSGQKDVKSGALIAEIK
ncbi:MAG: small ribosomal subunit Rsm22 family protein [Treponema sp.]|nr:small ribosomal subunit Rsm22 family protein [Treponema sp.]